MNDVSPASWLPMPDMHQVVGSHDIVFITLDTLRYDVAQQQFLAGNLPVLAHHLPPQGWQQRHTPASFTFAAHQAFFAGFLPTLAAPDAPRRSRQRLFAGAFEGSETTGRATFVFDEAHLPAALSARGYHSLCIGGTGFFNQLTALGCVLPSMFDESHWKPAFAVTQRHSAEQQVKLAQRRLAEIAQRVFLFINISAIHAPNRHYLPGCEQDDMHSHAAALRHVDAALAPLFAACAQRGPTFVIICSDHGSAYGDDGYQGHRLAHASVWDVPITHFFIPSSASESLSL